MVVADKTGDVKCSTLEEYKKQLQRKLIESSGNEIWCSCNGGAEDYPCIAILVKGNQAVINYFSENNEEMYASVGDESKDGTIEFENGQYEVAEYQVIPVEKALECALQFFCSKEKASCIEWEEL